jgi:hypothetical protein
MSISRCPRCAEFSYEQLRTHGFCPSCNFSEDLVTDDSALAAWVNACLLVDELEKIESQKQNATQITLSERSTQRFLEAVQERKEEEARYAEV